MKRIAGALAVTALLGLAAAATANAYQFRISDPGHRLAPDITEAIQRAVSFQVNRQVAEFWPRINPVSFTPAGALVNISTPAAVNAACEGEADGCHASDLTIWINGQQSLGDVENTISHEIVEAEIDPHDNLYINGRLVEICDPFSWSYRGLGGISVADFAIPAYFHGHFPGDFKGWALF